jgi:hypothetical protein
VREKKMMFIFFSLSLSLSLSLDDNDDSEDRKIPKSIFHFKTSPENTAKNSNIPW